jgi:hypothetical protein
VDAPTARLFPDLTLPPLHDTVCPKSSTSMAHAYSLRPSLSRTVKIEDGTIPMEGVSGTQAVG